VQICIPIFSDKGLESAVCPHFGSAPAFLVVDTGTRACRAIANDTARHEHGRCHPLAVLAAEPIDGIIVSGVGRNALEQLRRRGLDVFECDRRTAAEALDALDAGLLRPIADDRACAGRHGHSHRG
jgi:predicted Fe-Mo cluster-binding NifX family protein